jgi:hypothetical protein
MNSNQLAFDGAMLTKAILAGAGPQLIEELARAKGIAFDASLGPMHWFKPGVNLRDFHSALKHHPEINHPLLALDANVPAYAQSQLVTVANASIPAFLADYLDPKVILILVSPMKAALIVGEVQKGDWLTQTSMFLTVEQGGRTATYGDYSKAGISNVNVNFPQRQSYIFQAFLRYGQRELGIAGLAKLDWASQQQASNAVALMKQLNDVYFYGVQGLENYGLLNDPSLPAPITPTFSWLTNTSATAYTIYQDIVRMFTQLQAQSNGVVEEDTNMVLALSPENAVALKFITQFNTNSVLVLLQENFPNLRIEKAVQYATPSGQLVQLFKEELNGQRTGEAAFSSKLMAHNMVVESSSWEQKRSSGGYGTIWYRPFLVVSMLG